MPRPLHGFSGIDIWLSQLRGAAQGSGLGAEPGAPFWLAQVLQAGLKSMLKSSGRPLWGGHLLDPAALVTSALQGDQQEE